ncbi:hypothetical protein ACFZAR_44335 [Streptomyces sp. NPDC008222]|uniref:hypothetical protein n=1 Tax=Streptomyces sp. NPDC008222 TaxID=3364820 RepID=UPI0036EFF19A
MTSVNPVQDHIDELEADEDRAAALLERTLHLAGRQADRHLAPRLAERTLRLAVTFHRRAGTARRELTDFINYMERDAR